MATLRVELKLPAEETTTILEANEGGDVVRHRLVMGFAQCSTPFVAYEWTDGREYWAPFSHADKEPREAAAALALALADAGHITPDP